MSALHIPILMYHSVDSPVDAREQGICLPPLEFALQMEYLHSEGYTPVSLDQLIDAAVHGGELPFRPVVITFDDGYADNAANALPVLLRHGFPATVFVVSGCIGDINTWDATAGMPERRLLSWDSVREMHSNGITIGSHTVTHRRLANLAPEEALSEVRESKRSIEEHVGASVQHFSYPYGEMSESVAAVVREAGYLTACTTMSGFNGAKMDLFALRRLDIYGTDTLSRFVRKLTYGSNDGSVLTSLRYYGRRVLEKAGVGQ